MSGGGILGAVVGGVIGFFIGGPMGAIYGAGMGFSLGSMLDPLTPDQPTPGVPDVGVTVMTSTVGDPVPLVLGTAKITGHLLCYGKERTVEITETQEVQGGKGGGGSQTQTYVTGHKHYMTWVLGLCVGPVDTLYTIIKNEDIVWEGELQLADAVNGQETISIDGVGSCTFYFGTSDQVLNSTIGELLENEDYNTPYRNFCYAVMDDCYIGDYPRTPTFHFVVSKLPEFDFSTYNVIQKYDCNPAHAIWYILTELSGLPESWLDTSIFNNIAYKLQLEYKGISLLLVNQQTGLDYIQTISNHIDGFVYYGSDGKFHLKLIRDDYSISTLPDIEEDSIVDDITFQRKNWIDTVNELKVQYTELTTIRMKEVSYSNLWYSGSNQANGSCSIGGGRAFEFTYCGGPESSMKWVEVHSYFQTVGITVDGSLWTWGKNDWGQCGQNSMDAACGVAKPTGTENYKWVKCGISYDATWAIRSDGSLWVCGHQWSAYGNLPLPITPSRVSVFTLVDATPSPSPSDPTGPEDMQVPSYWIDFNCGVYISQGIDTQGQIWVWGADYNNLTANGFRTTDVTFRMRWNLLPSDGRELNTLFTTIQGTQWFYGQGILASRLNGQYYVCGANIGGKFGLGHDNNVKDLTLVPHFWKELKCNTRSEHLSGVTQGGTAMAAGINGPYNILGLGTGVVDTGNEFVAVLDGLSDVSNCAQICTSKGYGGLVLTNDGNLYAWGELHPWLYYHSGTGISNLTTYEFPTKLDYIDSVIAMADCYSGVTSIFKQ